MKREIAPVSILPCCILVTFIKTAVFLLCMTVTVILKLICDQKISCLMGNQHTGNNLHVVAQHLLVRSAFFPTALISEEFLLAAQRAWRMQHEGTLSLSCSSKLQLVFLKNHIKADDIFILILFIFFSSCDVIYLVFVSIQFTSIPCENTNQVIVLLALFLKDI